MPAEVTWTPPAASTTGTAHFCIVVRMPLYIDPGNPTIVELTELNNVAQSNYSRFISSDASPAVRGLSSVDVHNPYDMETRFWVVPSQTSEFFRTYVGMQWLKVPAGATRTVEVMYESLVGDPAFASTAGEMRQKVYKMPNVVSLVGLAENPHEKPHNAEVVGGATIQVAAARATEFDWIKVDGPDVFGRVVDKGNRTPVPHGRVLVAARLKEDPDKELYASGVIFGNGEFHVRFRRLRRLPKHLLALVSDVKPKRPARGGLAALRPESRAGRRPGHRPARHRARRGGEDGVVDPAGGVSGDDGIRRQHEALVRLTPWARCSTESMTASRPGSGSSTSSFATAPLSEDGHVNVSPAVSTRSASSTRTPSRGSTSPAAAPRRSRTSPRTAASA